MTAAQKLRAPFPWFGGKRLIAPMVWDRFGDVPNYVEPFFGSGAVMLGRPTPPRVETVNDKDALLSNFWRAVRADPEAVARWADWPVSEPDLHARHLFLVNRRAWIESMMVDPDYFDAKIAGWWVWGLCSWIGGGWCAPATPEAKRPHLARRGGQGVHRKHPDLRQHVGQTGQGASGRGIHGQMSSPRRQIPDLQADSGAAGKGVRRSAGPSRRRPLLQIGESGPGVHRKRVRLADAQGGAGVHRKRPAVTDRAGANTIRPHLRGVSDDRLSWLIEMFGDLSDRLRNVRVVCGEWDRILGPTPTWKTGLTGVFLDPPYSLDERTEKLYVHDGGDDLADKVRAWAIANGDNPLLRIALCGYDTEHGDAMPKSWTAVAWKAHGGYGSQAKAQGRAQANSAREVVWFSPPCQGLGLFDGLWAAGGAG